MDDFAPLYDPNSKLTAYEQAWIYLTEATEDLERTVGLEAERWGELGIAQVALTLIRGVETVMPNSEQIFYRVTDDAATALVAQAAEIPDAFDAARKVVEANIWNWEAMPRSLQSFSVGVLNGTFKRPKQQGGGFTNLFLRWQIYEGCQSANDLFGLGIYRQDHQKANSAADLLSNLSSEFGHSFAHNTIRDWFAKKEYARFRCRCDGLTDYVRETQMLQLGLLKRPQIGCF